MTRFAALLAALLWPSLLIGTHARASIFCARRKVLPAAGVQYTFLRSIPRQGPASLRLYQVSWSPRRALLGCAWSDDAAAIRDYASLCRERAREFSDQLEEGLRVGSVLGEEDPCVSVASPRLAEARRVGAAGGGSPAPPGAREEGSRGRSLHRMKRGFIVPGTLWCGSGNKAPSFGDLGLFTETDSCCREHDQCKNTILSFHSQFGVFNSNIFTMSHCDCDRKFRSCLLEAGDGISDAVGYTFFNLLKMHCFEFSHRLQCAQRNWFGMCKESKMTLFAEVHPPDPYEAPAQLNTSGSVNTTEPEELMQNSTTQRQVPSSSAAGLHTHTPWTGSPPTHTPWTSSPATPITEVSASAALSGAVSDPGASPTRNQSESDPPTRNQSESDPPTRNQSASDLRGTQQSCSVYRDLDECGTKIPPLQTRFGLRNPDSTTLHHCNCTSRLFQMLANQRQLTEVDAALLGRVSPSCFLLQNCTAGKVCASVQLTAQLPERHRIAADAVKKRHLLAASAKARRPNRKERAGKLHRVCLRMVGKLSGSAGWKSKTRKPDKDSQQAAAQRGRAA